MNALGDVDGDFDFVGAKPTSCEPPNNRLQRTALVRRR